jgi:DNA-binding response OmpR family regulator
MTDPLVFVADDDPLLLGLLEHKLKGAGYRVETAEDGQAALIGIGRARPDAVVLDALMPVMDGFETLRRLQADPLLRRTPVVMLTALRQEEHVLNALKLGAADFIAKPFSPDELLARLSRLLRRAAA